ncbi:MAG TPA: transglycosylase SLT domain-containing protein, partial [Ktedonobacteraceae bacterium]|nr:transglycosylase SLT domain-containing protein [Ktedonobacteraceae bacterium]
MATLTDAQIAGLARSAGFPDSEIPRAVAIALAESGGRTDVIGHNTNGTVDVGLWQINSVHGHSTASMQDPVQNAQAAHQIWAAAGNRWTPWVTFNRG